MLKSSRQSKIRDLVEDNGQVAVAELIHLLNVSEATVRRDLDEMSQHGLIQRTHGGAIRHEPPPKEPPMMQRMREKPTEKAIIGKTAAQLVQNGETIFLGSGTTVIEIARNLPSDIELTVITNSLPVVNELAHHQSIELIVIGGMLRQSELSMVGHVAEQAVREFRADRAFMGMYAIDVGCGFTNDYPPEIMTDRAILEISPRIVVVADSSKFGRVNSLFLAPVTAASMIITDDNIPDPIREELVDLGIDIRVVHAE